MNSQEKKVASYPDVVCFAGDDYWVSNPHSRYHIAHALRRRGHRVLWVSNIGMNIPKVRKKGFLKRVLLRMRSWTRWLETAEPDFVVMTPIALPLFGNKFVEGLLDRWLLFQVRLAMRIGRFSRPMIFASIPTMANVVAKLPNRGVIYYYSDKYSAYRDITARESIIERDELLFESADAVFCASRPILDELVDKRPGVFYMPHAVDFRRFNTAAFDDRPVPEDLASITNPVIGYFGSIDDSNDFQLIRYLAEKEPSWQFVMIGRVMGDLDGIQSLPNVHTLGFKPYQTVPYYGKGFDLGIMFWKMTDWIRHSHPLKTREYLSLGIPVVSVAIEEVEREYEGIVSIAETPEEFLAAIRRELAEDTPEKRTQRIQCVQGESWDARVEEMIERFEKELARGKNK